MGSGSRTKISGSTVLVVDDNDDNCELLAMVLRGDGLIVTTANGGSEALAIAESERPDVIVLDLAMPGMDGFETLARLRASVTCRDTHVIVFSAFDDELSRHRAAQVGANDFVAKPCQPREMLARVNAACATIEALAASSAAIA